MDYCVCSVSYGRKVVLVYGRSTAAVIRMTRRMSRGMVEDQQEQQDSSHALEISTRRIELGRL